MNGVAPKMPALAEQPVVKAFFTLYGDGSPSPSIEPIGIPRMEGGRPRPPKLDCVPFN